MLKLYSKMLAAVALACLGSTAYAQCPVFKWVKPVECNNCAETCDTGCNTGGGVYGSAGILFLKSYANGNLSYSTFATESVNGVPVSNITTVNEFDNGVDIGYRATIGYSGGDGWGGRIRYFKWESADNQTAVDNTDGIPVGGTGVVSRLDAAAPLGLQFFTSFGSVNDPTTTVYGNIMRVEIWDLELTKNTTCGCMDLTWSAGLRYLQLNQQYNATEKLNGPPSDDRNFESRISQTLRSQHTLNGLGPILGLEGRHNIFDNLSVYGLGRVGFIFMEGRQEAYHRINHDPDTVPPFIDNPELFSAQQDRAKMVTTAEVELGLEYGVSVGNSQVYARGGLLVMHFGGVGNSSRSARGAGPFESQNDNLSLFGLTASIGIRY